jgi:2-polyprenyl-3-methyl-5-hydroxy-6-metoxy-1,4-benzoquinol methylase
LTCRACGGSERAWAFKDGHRLTRCRRCRTILARREAGAATVGADYTDYHRSAGFAADPVVPGALERLVADADSYRQTGRWLDVGFGEGALLSAAGKEGWESFGVEAAPQALAFGRSRGWQVLDPAEAEERLPTGHFDVVTLVEVIEHLEEPLGTLGRAARWLRPGGLLFLTTPNAGSLNCLLLGPRWSVICPPEHLTIWSRSGLRLALARLGLMPVRVRTHGLNPAEILAAVRPRGDAPVHRQRSGESLNAALTRTRFRRLVKSAANGGLSLLGAGDTVKAWCEKAR